MVKEGHLDISYDVHIVAVAFFLACLMFLRRQRKKPYSRWCSPQRSLLCQASVPLAEVAGVTSETVSRALSVPAEVREAACKRTLGGRESRHLLFPVNCAAHTGGGWEGPGGGAAVRMPDRPGAKWRGNTELVTMDGGFSFLSVLLLISLFACEVPNTKEAAFTALSDSSCV